MNDFEDFISQGLKKSQPEAAWADHLRKQSGQALSHHYQQRLWTKRIGLAVVMCVLTLAAFLGGQHSVPSSGMQAGLNSPPDSNTVLVSKDLVLWLDTARLFTQLNMPERANNAYQQASQLTEAPAPQAMAVDQGREMSSYALLLSRCDPYVQQQHGETSVPRSTFNRVLAQSLGGLSHDHPK